MQYIIMIIIVMILAVSDIFTGFLKAHINNDYCSAVMRAGGWRKLGELAVMTTACSLEIGIKMLGEYYEAEQLASFAGKFAAIAVFGYITIMELVSILENYAQIEPNAAWVQKFLKKLRNVEDKEDGNDTKKSA